jgi:hypothetical protein
MSMVDLLESFEVEELSLTCQAYSLVRALSVRVIDGVGPLENQMFGTRQQSAEMTVL